jgi:hypothetical protein
MYEIKEALEMVLLQKLLKIQAELKAPKNQYNEFGEFYYRSCEDILSAAKPLCIREGILLYVTDDVKMIGDRYYVKATASVTDGENTIFAEAYARETESRTKMDAAQLTGSASSYARKYALNGLFCLDDTKDADAMKPAEEAPKKAKAKAGGNRKTDSLLALKAEMERLSVSNEDVSAIFKMKYGKQKWADLTDAEAADMAANVGNYAVELMNGEDEKLMEGIS